MKITDTRDKNHIAFPVGSRVAWMVKRGEYMMERYGVVIKASPKKYVVRSGGRTVRPNPEMLFWDNADHEEVSLLLTQMNERMQALLDSIELEKQK
jgi:hypothetical protein